VRHPYEYALLRAVPRVERGEQVNVGVLLYCGALDFLAARTHLDPDRLLALDPALDLDQVRAQLRSVEQACAGDAACGSVTGTAPGQRFRWLVAPRSTIIQPSEVHTGLTDDPARELEHLLAVLVLPAPH
jgi:hypothetical protein